MTLSLWILMDWLKDYSPSISCKNNNNKITGIRFYKPDMSLEPYALYLGTSDAFTGDGGSSIVCRNRSDSLCLETDDLLEVFNKIQDAFSFYGKWYDKCVAAISSGCSLNALLSFAAEIFSTPLLIVDAAQIHIASSSDITGFEAPEDLKSISSYRSIPEEKLKRFNYFYKDSFYYSGTFPIPAGFFPTKSYCRHIFLNEERLGTIILKAPQDDCTTGTLLLLDLFAPLVEEWVQTNADSASAFRLRAYFACTLRGDSTTLPGLQRQLILSGWSADCRKQVYVICSPSNNLKFDVYLLRNMANNGTGAFVTLYQNKLVVLCNFEMIDEKSFVENLCNIMKKNEFSGATGFSFTDLERLRDTYRQTLTTLKNSPCEAGQLYRSQDVAMKMVSKLVCERFSSSLLHPILAEIKAHDASFKTDYYRTLFFYLKNERRHQQTAEELFIHRNTLFLRLEKIDELWRPNLDSADERFYLLFSFYQEQNNSETHI